MDNEQDIILSIMTDLEIYKPYIQAWKKDQTVTFYERYGGYWLWQEEQAYDKMKELQEQYGIIIYAALHNMTTCGEMWSYCYVDQDAVDKSEYISEYGHHDGYYLNSVVWNVDSDSIEFGDIVVNSFGGGLNRIY